MRLKDKKCGNCYHSLWYTYPDGSKILWCIQWKMDAEEVTPEQKACDDWEFDEEELESDR